MNTILKLATVLALCISLVGSAWGSATPSGAVAGSIQAIEQAPDPSAVVAAFANGMAADRNNPKLFNAYVARMVDFGMPELAYHQAQTLTGLDSENGLGWGVIAYVNARRGDMPEAIAAINLAGQFAPKSHFVQRTAGEIIAWYDVKAQKSKIPAPAKDGLAKIRALLGKTPDFASAYSTAKTAYETPPSTTPQPGQPAYQPVPPDSVAPGTYYDEGQPPAVYYPSYYYYDWGPGWITPAPWWWWWPSGYFVGFDFFPFSSVFVFHDHHHFHDHDFFFHDHDRDFFHGHDHDGLFVHHDGRFINNHANHAFWHNDPAGHTTFFGAPVRANAALGQWNRDSMVNRSRVSIAKSGGMLATRGSISSSALIPRSGFWAGTGRARTLETRPSARTFSSVPSTPAVRSFRSVPSVPSRTFTVPARPGNGMFSSPSHSSGIIRGFRPSGQMARPSAPAIGRGARGGFSAGRGGFPGGAIGGGFHSGGFRGGAIGGGFHGGGFHGGGFHGGGFHGGGFHGGSFHGGGGRR